MDNDYVVQVYTELDNGKRQRLNPQNGIPNPMRQINPFDTHNAGYTYPAVVTVRCPCGHEMKPLVLAESFCDACLSDISDDIRAYRCSRPTTKRRFGDDSGPKYLELLRTEKRRGEGIIPTCEYALCVRCYNDPEMRIICKMYAATGHGPTQLVPPAAI
jgi:hypothetical protein